MAKVVSVQFVEVAAAQGVAQVFLDGVLLPRKSVHRSFDGTQRHHRYQPYKLELSVEEDGYAPVSISLHRSVVRERGQRLMLEIFVSGDRYTYFLLVHGYPDTDYEFIDLHPLKTAAARAEKRDAENDAPD